MSDYEAHVAEVIKQVPEADPEKVTEAFARYEKDFLIPQKTLCGLYYADSNPIQGCLLSQISNHLPAKGKTYQSKR